MKESIKTVGDLKAFARRQARFDMSNYDRDSFRYDDCHRKRARYKAKKNASFYWNKEETPLVIGKYFNGRLHIRFNGIEYQAGQYAPTEIYWALADYFSQTRGV